MVRMLRERVQGRHARVTTLELFFDLVFVFAVTQLSHLLLQNLTWTGVGQTAMLLLLVWWAWNYTTWFTNWVDPDDVSVRVVLIDCMLASLLMAVGIPDAFGDRALLFAGGYVVLQVGRSAWAVWAFRRGTIEGDNFFQILVWFLVSGVLWIAGALAPHGSLTVDAGAAAAIRAGKSLLPAGVTEVGGAFEKGDAVRILDPEGREIARGLARYDSADAARIRGLQSAGIEAALGYTAGAALVHADDLAPV